MWGFHDNLRFMPSTQVKVCLNSDSIKGNHKIPMNDNKLNPQAVLDQILNVGKDYLQKGQDLAEDKLNIPEEGEQREVMLNGLKKGALATAVLVGLVGTRGGRKLTGVALRMGGIAALGTAAVKGYQSWMEKKNSDGETAVAVHKLDGDDALQRSKLLISAMVSAAHADGNIGDEEQIRLKHEILEMHLPSHLAEDLKSIINEPLNAKDLAAQVTNLEAASEVYLASRIFIDEHSTAIEKNYLDQLVADMGVDQDLVAALEEQVA